MSLPINDAERSAIRTFYLAIKDEFKVNKLLLFGSKTRGDAEKYSDIDLLVLTDKERNLKDRYRISDISADINIDYGVAISCLYYNVNDWELGEAINPLLKQNIEREGIVLDL